MIELIKVTKKYNNKIILNNIDLKLENHKFNFIIGNNGSGKTTLLKCILNLENYNGKILFDGDKIDKIRNKILTIYDDTPLYSNLSGYENILIILNNKKIFDKNELLELNLLTHKKLKEKVGNYSLGERKKLYFLIIYLKKPKYLFMDEISNGLDIETLLYFKEYLKKLTKNTLIVSTGHHFDFYKDIVQNLIILNNGIVTVHSDFQDQGGDLNEFYKKYIQTNKN